MIEKKKSQTKNERRGGEGKVGRGLSWTEDLDYMENRNPRRLDASSYLFVCSFLALYYSYW